MMNLLLIHPFLTGLIIFVSLIRFYSAITELPVYCNIFLDTKYFYTGLLVLIRLSQWNTVFTCTSHQCFMTSIKLYNMFYLFLNFSYLVSSNSVFSRIKFSNSFPIPVREVKHVLH